MATCEVFKVRNSGDEWGVVCGHGATARCYDCGIPVCEQHVETCSTCLRIFCSGCMAFHLQGHAKTATSHTASKMRKSA